GHDITMYCRSEYVTGTSRQHKGVRLRYAPAVRTRAFETLSHVGASLIHALTIGRVDVVHLHSLAPNVFSRICRARGIPTVATVHGLDWQRTKWSGVGSKVLQFAERSMVADIDSIIVVSRALRDYYRSRYGRATY